MYALRLVGWDVRDVGWADEPPRLRRRLERFAGLAGGETAELAAADRTGARRGACWGFRAERSDGWWITATAGDGVSAYGES